MFSPVQPLPDRRTDDENKCEQVPLVSLMGSRTGETWVLLLFCLRKNPLPPERPQVLHFLRTTDRPTGRPWCGRELTEPERIIIACLLRSEEWQRTVHTSSLVPIQGLSGLIEQNEMRAGACYVEHSGVSQDHVTPFSHTTTFFSALRIKISFYHGNFHVTTVKPVFLSLNLLDPNNRF